MTDAEGSPHGDPHTDPHSDAHAHDCGTPGPWAGTDSAGVPWKGRRFEPNPHSADDGSADPALHAALLSFRDGSGGEAEVVDAYRAARLLIPLIAEAGESGVAPSGLAVDKTQELSIVTVAAPDGRAVLPVFTSVETMRTWDASARPVPADGVRTAIAAAEDDTDLIVIDPGSASEFIIRRPALWAIANGQPWEPAAHNPAVFEGLQQSIGGELGVLDLSVEAGDPDARLRGPELIVRLHLVEGLERAELDAILQRLAARWAKDDRIAVLVDSLTVKLVRA